MPQQRPGGGPPSGPPPPQWPHQQPPPAGGRGRTAGFIALGLGAAVLLAGGAAAIVVYSQPSPVLSAPSSPCTALEEGTIADYEPGDLIEGGYSTCRWKLQEPGLSEDSDIFLYVRYEEVAEPMAGTSPGELASFLVQRTGARYESGSQYDVDAAEEIEEIGDEARHVYFAFENDGYGSGSSIIVARRANVVVTVETSGSSSDGEGFDAVPEDELRPIAENVAEEALADIGHEKA